MAKIDIEKPEVQLLKKCFIKNELTIKISSKNVMGVKLPVIKLNNLKEFEQLNFLLTQQSEQLDLSVKSCVKLLPKLILMAQKKQSMKILQNEMVKTRRKVNALKNLIIPNYVDTIKSISLKLKHKIT